MGTIPTLLVVSIVVGYLRALILENRERRADPRALTYPHAVRYLRLHTIVQLCACTFAIRALLWDWLRDPATNTLAVVFTLATLAIGQARTRAALAANR